MNILIVDMIEGFARQGALSSPRVAALIPKQVEFLKRLPDGPHNVVLACDAHLRGDPELKRMPQHCMAETTEADICPEILDVLHEKGIEPIIIRKESHSAFFDTPFDDMLLGLFGAKKIEGDDWIVFGCVTDICIAANVMELDYRGKNVTVVRDLVDTYEITEEQAKAMGNPAYRHDPEIYNDLFLNFYLPGVWGAKIVNSADIKF